MTKDRTIKILVVDDDEPSRDGLMKLIKCSWKLNDVGLEIVGVTNLADGLKESEGANVTILDLDLPDSDMVNTIQCIRLFTPPVIVLTGSDDPAVTASCMKNGADHVYLKGTIIGLIPAMFESLQKDIIRRANGRCKT